TASTSRTYYRNAGRTRRRGFEGALMSSAGPLEAQMSYSYSQFEFERYVKGTVDLKGKRIPGIPRNLVQGALTYRWRSAFATAEGIAGGSAFVNDENTQRAQKYEVLNLRAGAASLFGRPSLSPFVGVQNLFDRTYSASVAINATNGRYYEPAPGRQVYVGLTLGVGR
ncbi:MAG TPA: TonB-dependent receptor, partial [Gemmatimonadaceae bacterium]|nr:TonB-dependent receptor [Gemmatimonadaceae bacterium]